MIKTNSLQSHLGKAANGPTSHKLRASSKMNLAAVVLWVSGRLEIKSVHWLCTDALQIRK